MRRVYLDMDGVLADFDAGYEKAFGVRSVKETDNVDWKLVRNRKHFYRGLPPMPDLDVLWKFFEPYRPCVLTGVPSSVPEAHENKREWARKHLGADIPIITTLSKEKSLYAHEGDILVDDWNKYKHLWENKGGIWITHTSALNTIEEFERIFSKKSFNTNCMCQV